MEGKGILDLRIKILDLILYETLAPRYTEVLVSELPEEWEGGETA